MYVVQNPSADKWSCQSLRRYNVYTRPTTGAGPGPGTAPGPGAGPGPWTFLQSVDVYRHIIKAVDPFINLSIGVSLLNNALLESDISEVIYVGSASLLSKF